MRYSGFGRTGLFVVAASVGVAGLAATAEATPRPAYSSSKFTQDEVSQTGADQTTGLISDRISDITGDNNNGGTASLDSGTNKAAGSAPLTNGLWFNVAGTKVNDTHNGAAFDGPIYTMLVGYDTKVTDSLLLGVATGYEHIDINTDYNGGALRGNSWTVAPYASYQITQMLSVNATIGHTWVHYNEEHGSVSGTTDGDRWFGTANIVAKQSVNQWRLTENLGYFYVTETQDAYTETNLNPVDKSTRHLGQIRVGGKAGYYIPTIYGYLEPYVTGRAEFDVDKSSDQIISSGTTVSRSDFGATFGAGLKVSVGDSVSVSGELTSTAFRDKYQAYGASATVGLKF